MNLEILGPSGTVSAETDRLRLRLKGMNTRSDFTEVTCFLTADSFEGFSALVRDGVDRYGIDSDP